MDFIQAYRTVVKRSVERNTKEIPLILSCLDFEGLDCLEIGPGPDARVAIKVAGFAKHITTLVKNKSDIASVNRRIKAQGLEKKISAASYDGQKFPFKNNSFDVVYAAWLPHKVVTNPSFLDEMIRVAKKHVLLVMPGIKGDEPPLVSIVRPGEKKRRQEYRRKISAYLRSKAWKVNYKEDILRLDFDSLKEMREMFYCLAFKNQPLAAKKKQVDSYLNQKRVHNYRNGFYILHAEK